MAARVELLGHVLSYPSHSKVLSTLQKQKNIDLSHFPSCPSAQASACCSSQRGISGSISCSTRSHENEQDDRVEALHSTSRRQAAGLLALTTISTFLPSEPSLAREKRKPRNIPEDDYKTGSDGLKFYDFLEGKGETAENGMLVSVHFDCIYKTLTVISSRESKLLGGNRIIAQPYDFVVGSKPGSERKRDSADSANGLFSAQAAPKPPRALYTITEGMKVGGKRTVIVPPEEGYGQRGLGEIPPGAEFEMNIELLEIKKA